MDWYFVGYIMMNYGEKWRPISIIIGNTSWYKIKNNKKKKNSLENSKTSSQKYIKL